MCLVKFSVSYLPLRPRRRCLSIISRIICRSWTQHQNGDEAGHDYDGGEKETIFDKSGESQETRVFVTEADADQERADDVRDGQRKE